MTMCNSNTKPPIYNSERADFYFRRYSEYASDLRKWFVVYGVGGVALFYSKAEVFKSYAPGTKIGIVISFVVAVSAQILLVFIRKWSTWCLYASNVDEEFKSTRLYKVGDVMTKHAWIDALMDVISLVAFACATFLLVWGLYT